MQNRLLKIVVCPKCLGNLELRAKSSEKEEVKEGSLYCPNCRLDFAIKDGVAIFGIEARAKEERTQEIKGENEWIFTANELQVHIDFARKSSRAGEEIIQKLKDRTKNERIQRKLCVLDLGAGWGCLQSWQFRKHGFEVVAVDLCPEFILSSDVVAKTSVFERVVTDCSILPFGNDCFDIVFCKELIHHVTNPMELLNEIWRVTSPRGLIVIREPFIPVFLTNKCMARMDPASKVGIVHHYCTYRGYLDYMNKIASELEVDDDIPIIDPTNHRILNLLQRAIILLGNIIPKMRLMFLEGSIEIIGTKKVDYKSQQFRNRDVIPIDIRGANVQQIEFYREELIPKVLEVFSKTYEEYNNPIP